nr:type II toxin-antitoxin system ParD family antitoxin [uncultured Desulfobacter sp.]
MRQEKSERITITLPPDMLNTIKKKVSTGLYGSTSELIREAVRVWQKKEDEHQAKLDVIRKKLEHSAQNGKPIPIATAFKKIEKIHKQRIETAPQ